MTCWPFFTSVTTGPIVSTCATSHQRARPTTPSPNQSTETVAPHMTSSRFPTTASSSDRTCQTFRERGLLGLMAVLRAWS
jgi:hypothetical protein